MARTMTVEIFTFDELGDDAKQKAREWYREGAFDHEWYDCTMDDAKECLKHCGFDIGDIRFSGFWSQGDGACFDNTTWDASDVDVKALQEHAPQDQELHRLVAALAEISGISTKDGESALDAGEAIFARIKHTGHYSHEHSSEIDGENFNTLDDETAFGELARDAMKWAYRRLEAEYDYINSDEQIDETIRINEYDFTASGSRTTVVG